MVVTQQSRDLITSIFKFADTGSEATVRQGMKTTNVAGYPVILSRARWGGSEVNASGNNKAFLFLPYLQSGPMPLQKYNRPLPKRNNLPITLNYNGILPSPNMSQLREYIEKHPSETQRLLGLDYDQLMGLIINA